METKKNYNPLNEGYTGETTSRKGYTGSENSESQAPLRIANVQSGVVKPETNTSNSKTDQNQ